MEPLYKIYSQVIGEDPTTLQKTLGELGIRLKKESYYLDSKPLLKLVLTEFFGKSTGFVDMVLQHIPSPLQNAKKKVISTLKLLPIKTILLFFFR